MSAGLLRGGPAFPATIKLPEHAHGNAIDEFGSGIWPGGEVSYPGMSIRIWLAGQALPFLAAALRGPGSHQDIAHQALALADTIIEEDRLIRPGMFATTKGQP